MQACSHARWTKIIAAARSFSYAPSGILLDPQGASKGSGSVCSRSVRRGDGGRLRHLALLGGNGSAGCRRRFHTNLVVASTLCSSLCHMMGQKDGQAEMKHDYLLTMVTEKGEVSADSTYDGAIFLNVLMSSSASSCARPTR